ncbi:two-component system histidine kinase PnpS [Oceanobacillus bengalensis]|uniref:histidine kinase n=1 Tax=Oceanobacillus bengalensis TaxID=1435466 RepID=A0A494YY15_9BACI|nr:HAMP domain-containing sensor histidine kinase [Oceanobacillus bengalensis]RKQ14908.1 PAS domain-containing protein [Oceanobacillus bengalensis]
MRDLFKKPLINFTYIISFLMLFTGIVLSTIVENFIILIAVLLFDLILFLVILQFIYTSYMKPVKKATEVINEIGNGNYQARFNHSTNDYIGKLSYKINTLSRNLREISIQEQAQSEQLSTIIDNTQNGLVLIDEKGYIHLVNRKFITMFGKTSKEYNGYIYYDVLEHEIFHKTVQNTFLYEKNIKSEFSHYIGIEKHYFEIIGVPIFNEKDRLKGAVIVIHDITELKKLEIMRKDFVANVSHELRTPITSIKGFAETLLEDGINDRENAKEFLKIIYKESDRMQLLIEDLLTLSRLEEENFQLVLNKIDVSELADEIVPTFLLKARKKKLNLTVSIEDKLELKADKEKLKQIFINLLDNAMHYTPENGKITLTVTSTADYVHIKVSDTGIGIEQKALPRIFERFYRVDKARSRNTGGTGLGLAIVKHIVEVHEGKITIDSEVNEGTNVHVYLPR